MAYTAPPDSPSHQALRFLLQWSARATDREDDHTANQEWVNELQIGDDPPA